MLTSCHHGNVWQPLAEGRRPIRLRLLVAQPEDTFVTTAEFMDELKKTRRTVEWRLEPDEGWTVERRSRPRYHIRGYAKKRPKKARVFDPIGAVCYRRTGEVYDPESWREASKALDLSPARAAELVAATYDRTRVGPVGRREPVEYLERLRSRLIAAVNPKRPTQFGPTPGSPTTSGVR